MFKTFPEFSKLTHKDKDEYEAAIRDFPPVGDVAFAGLMTWWNPLNHMSISVLNDNFVLPYWIPGDDKHSGLSIVGTNKIDESICTIFDYQKERGEKPRLVNVPEFVIGSIQYPEMFHFKNDRARDEYVLGVSKFYPLNNMVGHRRRKVERMLHRIGEENIVVKSLDLDSAEDRQLLLDAAERWQGRNINNYGKMEMEAIKTSIINARVLGSENAALFVNGELYGFCLYATTMDRRYVVIHCVKATNQRALGFELLAYAFAKWFANKGVMFGNVNADYGILRLRMFMLTLGPDSFFRKYTIEPSVR